ncbi:MAG: DUF2235 domain-containing protein [Nitrospirota bacterium]|nr:DUF2235 domain-containing protein [Nitrospirota bacterium]
MARNLIFCFDGTSNSPKDAVQDLSRRGELEDDSITNVLKLHLMMGGDLKNRPLDGTQHSFYYRGVGTYGGGMRRLINRVFAPEKQDVGSIIRTACADLKRHYQPGDRVFLFGFSRGAAIARRFATVARERTGIAAPPGTHLFRYLAAFDTVASLGQPNLNRSRKPKTTVLFENRTISPDIRHALHLLSIDERRVPFMPTLMNRDRRVTEVWMPGVHSDVGGGFRLDGLSDLALEVVLNDLRQRRTGLTLLSPASLDYDWLRAAGDRRLIEPDDMALNPDPAAPAHPVTRLRGFLRKQVLTDRWMRVIFDDKPLPGGQPLVHHSVRERVHRVAGYRPRPLSVCRFGVLEADGSITHGVTLNDLAESAPKAAQSGGQTRPEGF